MPPQYLWPSGWNINYGGVPSQTTLSEALHEESRATGRRILDSLMDREFTNQGTYISMITTISIMEN